MDTLRGEEAQDVRGDWWDVVHDPTRKPKHIIHVIRLDKPSSFIQGLQAYAIWKQHGPTAVAEALRCLARESAGWTYIVNALGTRVNRVSNYRILITPQAALEDPDSTQRFWLEVYGPFFAAECHETVWVLTEDEVLAAGLELLEHDTNEWGANGVMRTHYTPEGQVTARDYIDRADPECQRDLDYIHSMLKLARKSGRQLEPIYPPA
jgi:hypothetical protein